MKEGPGFWGKGGGAAIAGLDFRTKRDLILVKYKREFYPFFLTEADVHRRLYPLYPTGGLWNLATGATIQLTIAVERRFSRMSQTIQVSEKGAAMLAEQAAAQGLSLEALGDDIVSEKAFASGTTRRSKTRAAAEGILEIQKRIKPDPEGWTVRDYIDHGRR
jgi:hypothetical protein